MKKREGRDKILVTIYPHKNHPNIQFGEIPEELINALVERFGVNLEIHVMRSPS